MLIDCFSFFNELDLLALRLRVLDPVVTHFIAVQGEETHAGNPKPMYLDPADARWRTWAGRLSSVTVPRMPPDTDRWTREQQMRHVKAAALAPYATDDVVILSCADEIPDPRLFPALLPALSLDQWVGFLTACYYYYLDLRCPKAFHCIQLARVDTVRHYGAEALSVRRKTPPIGPIPGGWHFSYLGGVEAIRTKLGAFAHAEYDTPTYTNPDRLAHRIANHQDPITRDRLLPAPLSELPDEVQQYPDRYAAFLRPGRTP